MAETLRTNYDGIAGLYDVDRAHWVIRPDKVVTSLLGDGHRELRILDVGCGTGLYLCAQREHFTRSPVSWFGVDASTQMLSNARTKVPNISVAQARAEALPIATGSIDYVYSSFAFHHFTDKEAALDEVTRVLRERGRFRIRTMDPWGQPTWWIYQYFVGTWENDERRFWSVARIRSALEERGFDVESEVEIQEATRTVADVLDEAERRVISQLSILDDESYEKGIARLRALGPTAQIPYPRARLTLDAAGADVSRERR